MKSKVMWQKVVEKCVKSESFVQKSRFLLILPQTVRVDCQMQDSDMNICLTVVESSEGKFAPARSKWIHFRKLLIDGCQPFRILVEWSN